MIRLPHDRSRRRFLKRATLAGAALACPSVLLADPYRPLPASPGRAAPVRVRGRVASGGRGLAGVAVTDGVTVAATDADGAYELIADGRRPFVYLSLPAGYAVPRNPTGTARFYAPMRPEGAEMTAVFDLEPLAVTDERHAFCVLADPQTQDRFEMSRFHAETVPDVRATAAALGEMPVFGLACGDIMFDHLDLYPEYERAVAAMGLPFFQVIGNHDLDQEGMTDEASARTFSSYFGRRGESSPPPSVSITNREALYRLLEPFDAHIISGHTHENEHVFEHGTHEHVCGTACGAWWSGDICFDGTPNGYAVFEARGEELRWRYKSTGRDAGHQIRVYGRGADPKAPDEIVANVWDWDPAWTVVWYENGERRGAMARRIGTDPLSERLHRGPDKPEHRPWVEPVPVAHLFYAPVAPDADIRVEATDRFGRTYTASPMPPEPPEDE